MKVKSPTIPEGSTVINDIVCVENINGTWTYWVYLWPIYTHEQSQRAQFRYAASSLISVWPEIRHTTEIQHLAPTIVGRMFSDTNR